MNSQWLYLSYPIHPLMPAYGGNEAFFDEPEKAIEKGDSCNTRNWRMSNHIGTHIDCPRHFSPKGSTIDDYPAGFWVFKKTVLFEINNVKPAQLINSIDIDIKKVNTDVELLLFKTGFGNFRNEPQYWARNPGLHPDLASFLRRVFPNLRVLGFDFISLSSYANRDVGRQAHKSFLDHKRPLLPLEDVNLSHIDSKTKILQVIVAPLYVNDADGAPCTVLTEVVK